MVEVRRLRAGEGGELREIRLRALADAPSAFAGTYEEESARPTAWWADAAGRWATSGREAHFVAVEGGRWVGLAGAFLRDDAGRSAELVSMWTAPEARGRGIGAALVRAALDWAVGAGAGEMGLWVTRGNDAAARLYARFGFVPTGDVEPLPSDPCLDELRMVRPVTPEAV